MPALGWDKEKAPLSLWPVAVSKGTGQEVPVGGKVGLMSQQQHRLQQSAFFPNSVSFHDLEASLL